jgi:hypothetical protein
VDIFGASPWEPSALYIVANAVNAELQNALDAELQRGGTMNDIIYLVGVIVVIMAVLSLVGLR